MNFRVLAAFLDRLGPDGYRDGSCDGFGTGVCAAMACCKCTGQDEEAAAKHGGASVGRTHQFPGDESREHARH